MNVNMNVNYIVKCKALSVASNVTYTEGQTVTGADIELYNIDVQRLLDLGAVVIQADADEEPTASMSVEVDPDQDSDSGEDQTIELTKMKRDALDALAIELGIKDVDKLRNRAEVIEAIQTAQDALAATETTETHD